MPQYLDPCQILSSLVTLAKRPVLTRLCERKTETIQIESDTRCRRPLFWWSEIPVKFAHDTNVAENSPASTISQYDYSNCARSCRIFFCLQASLVRRRLRPLKGKWAAHLQFLRRTFGGRGLLCGGQSQLRRRWPFNPITGFASACAQTKSHKLRVLQIHL